MEKGYGILGKNWVLKEVLDEPTERLHFDIGMFFGDQFVKHYPTELSWSYYLTPKRDIFVKAPVIIGFGKYQKKDGTIGSNVAEPVHLVGSESRLIFQNKMSDDSLLVLGKVLMDKVYDFDTKAIIPPLEF